MKANFVIGSKNYIQKADNFLNNGKEVEDWLMGSGGSDDTALSSTGE